ncbi:MAG: hypothetical protein NC043_00135 [Muribaculaceae bacterium]|nr:hypothetical protein [Muribaculaceae bacterium]
MKRIAFIILAACVLMSCGGNKDAATEASGTPVSAVSVPADGSYSPAAVDSLIVLAHDGRELSQADYAAMIQQCSAINRLLMEKLKKVDFKSGMTDEEINTAMERLNTDTLIPRLERGSRELLVVLQNADLDTANTRRYDEMVEEVRRGLGQTLN